MTISIAMFVLEHENKSKSPSHSPQLDLISVKIFSTPSFFFLASNHRKSERGMDKIPLFILTCRLVIQSSSRCHQLHYRKFSRKLHSFQSDPGPLLLGPISTRLFSTSSLSPLSSRLMRSSGSTSVPTGFSAKDALFINASVSWLVSKLSACSSMTLPSGSL